MNQRSRLCGLGVLAAFTVVATLLCGRAMGESGRDLLLASEGTPGLGSILDPGGENPCDKAHTAFEAIPGAEGKLKAAQARLAAARSEEKDILAGQKLKRAEVDKKRRGAEKRLADMRKGRAGKKLGSAFELKPERDELLRELEADIRQTESTAGQGCAVAGRTDCPNGTSLEVCRGLEKDRRQLLNNCRTLFSSRLKLLEGLKSCVNISLRFFECRPAVVHCPAEGIMDDVSLGGARAEFDSGYKALTSGLKGLGDGDICRTAAAHYEWRLNSFWKKYGGYSETPEERRQGALKGAAEDELSRLDAELKPATEKTAAALRDVAELKAELAELEREYAAQGVECSKEACSPEIKMRQADWEISAAPEMPAILAAAPGGGEWTFQATWHYNTVHCDYPATPQPVSGTVLNTIKYAGADMFGGDYKVVLKSKCREGVKEVSRIGVIAGANPSRERIINEIRAIAGDANLEILTKIACHESGIKQFLKGGETDCPGKPGMPYACNPNDFGIFQISEKPDNHANHCKAAWNWRFNVKMGVDKWKTSLRNAENQHISEAMTADKHKFNEPLQKCITGKTHKALLAMINANHLSLNKLPLFDEMLKAAIIGGGFSDFKNSMKKEGVSEAKLVEFIKEFTASYYPDKMNEQQISDDAIRRFNGGRENRWDPIDSTIGFSSGNCRDGKWVAHPEETKNPEYITKVRRATRCISEEK